MNGEDYSVTFFPVRSETICMLGMVPVQVVGDVHMNEPLYASPDHPGVAVGGHQLDIKTLKEASFIGYSFSARKTYDESSVCFSISFLFLFQFCNE